MRLRLEETRTVRYLPKRERNERRIGEGERGKATGEGEVAVPSHLLDCIARITTGL